MPDPTARFRLTADDRASKTLRKVKGEIKGISRAVKSIGTISFGGLVGVGGLSAIATQSIAAADAIGKTADKLGLGVEALQEYRFAAEQSGVSTNTFDMAIQRLGRRLAQADNGTGEAVKALDELGVSTRNAQGQLKTVEEILPELADKFAGVANQIDRNRLAQKLFDSEGVALVNLLRNQSSGLEELRDQARATGGVLSDDLVRGAEEANDQLNIMKRTVDAQFTRAFVELAPVITDVSKAMAELAVQAGNALNAFSTGLGVAIGELVEGENTVVGLRQARIKRLEEQEQELIRKLSGRRLSRRPRNTEEQQLLEAELERVQGRIKLFKDSLKDPELQRLSAELTETARGLGKTPRVDSRPVEQDQPGRIGKRRQPRAKAVEQMTAAEKELAAALREAEALTQSLLTPTEKYLQQVAKAEELAARGLITDETRTRALTNYKQELEDATGVTERFARLQEVIADVDSVAPLLDQIAALEDLQEAYPQYADIVGEAIFDVQEEIDKVALGIDEQKEVVEDLGSAWQGFGDIVGSAFEDAVIEGESLSDVVKGLEKDILRLLTRNLVTKPLEGAIENLFSPQGAGGGFFASIFGGPRASGGPVTAGRAYLVGEEGPELVVPSKNAYVVPSKETEQKLGRTIINNFSIALPSDSTQNRRNAQQIAREAAGLMRSAAGAV